MTKRSEFQVQLIGDPNGETIEEFQDRILQPLVEQLARQIREGLRSGRLIVKDGYIISASEDKPGNKKDAA